MKRSYLLSLLFFISFTYLTAKDYSVRLIYSSKDKQEVDVYINEINKTFYERDFNISFTKKTVDTYEEYLKEVDQSDTTFNSNLLIGETVYKYSLKSKKFDIPTIVSSGKFKVKDIPSNSLYIYMKGFLEHDLKLIHDLKKVKVLAVVTNNPSTISKVKTFNEKYGFNIIFIKDNTEFQNSLKNNKVDGIYFISGSKDVADSILKVSNTIPVFNRSDFHSKLDSSSLIYFDPMVELQIRSKISGVTLLEVANKEPLKNIDNYINASDSNPLFNISIAKRLDLFPKLSYLNKISLIPDNNTTLKELNLEDGIKETVEDNLNIKEKDKTLAASNYDITTAKSDRRPQASLYSQYKKQDKDSSRTSWGGPENSLRGGVSLNYTIFDDEINTNVKVSKLNRDSKKYEYEFTKLNSIHNFADNYLNILKLQEDLKIEQYNYALLKKYLKIAQTNFEVGSSGPQDIYRFQSEIADSLSNIFQITGTLKSYQSNLNVILNAPQEDIEYSLKEVTDSDDSFVFISYFVKKIGLDLNKQKILRNYLSKMAIENSFKLKQIDASIAAKKQELKSAKRLRYLPKVSATGDISNDIKDPWGEGATNKNEDRWNAGVKFEIPIFQGGRIESNKNSLIEQLNALKYKRKNLVALTKQNVYSDLNDVEKYYFQTLTSKENSMAAKKNLTLVEDQYIQGTISISDLLDAKTNYVKSNSNIASNKYQYLKSIISLENSTNKDFFLISNSNRDLEIKKLDNIIEN